MNQCFPREEDESFSMLFWLPVFTGVPANCDAYQDSSLALGMTGRGSTQRRLIPQVAILRRFAKSAKLALRRAAMEYHYYSYPRTPYGPSRGNED